MPLNNKLLDLFLNRVQEDESLRKILNQCTLDRYFRELREAIVVLKQGLEGGQVRALQIGSNTQSVFNYLGEFETDYIYRKINNVAQSIQYYLEILGNRENCGYTDHIFRLTYILLRGKAKYHDLEGLRAALEYARGRPELHSTETIHLDTGMWYHTALQIVIGGLPISEARTVITEKREWVESLTGWFSIPIKPKYSCTYYYLTTLRNYSPEHLGTAPRSIEPEEFITYLSRLLLEGKLSRKRRIEAMNTALTNAREGGYSYFVMVIEKVLMEETYSGSNHDR